MDIVSKLVGKGACDKRNGLLQRKRRFGFGQVSLVANTAKKRFGSDAGFLVLP